MEDIEVNTPAVEASEPAERDLAEQDLAERPAIEEKPEAEASAADAPAAEAPAAEASATDAPAAEAPAADAPATDAPEVEAPEEMVAEQLLIVEDAAEPDMERARLRAIIEAVVYVTDEPLTLQQIAAALNHPIDKVQGIIEELVADYNRPERGLSIREVAGGYKMTTRPEHHEAVRTFVRNLKPPLKLSLAALETLAVVAYKQPVTAPEIMEIRGVQGAGVLKTLLDRKLVAVAGRKNVVGKPILYKTTRDFLIQFGLSDLGELPTLKEFEELSRMALSDEGPEAVRDAADATSPAPAEDSVSAEPAAAEPAASEAAGPASAPSMEESGPEAPGVAEPALAEAEPAAAEAPTAEVARGEAATIESATTEAPPIERTTPEAAPPDAARAEAVAVEGTAPEATTSEEG